MTDADGDDFSLIDPAPAEAPSAVTSGAPLSHLLAPTATPPAVIDFPATPAGGVVAAKAKKSSKRGAGLLKGKASAKTKKQKTAAPSIDVPPIEDSPLHHPPAPTVFAAEAAAPASVHLLNPYESVFAVTPAADEEMKPVGAADCIMAEVAL